MLEFLKLNIYSNAIVGLRPYEFRSKSLTKLHEIYCDLFLTSFIAFICTQLYEICNLIQTDMMALVDNLGVSLLYLSTLLKVLTIRSKRMTALLKTIEELEKIILNDYDSNCKEIYYYYVNYNKKIIKICVVVSALTLFPYYVTAAIDDALNSKELYRVVNETIVYEERPLPLSSWMPFDKYKHYLCTYLLQCYAVTIGGSYVYATDVFTYALLIFAVIPVKVLQYQFRNFKAASMTISDRAEEEIVEQRVLGNCVKFHHRVIKFVL